MKKLIKKWLDIRASDIIVQECECCHDESITQEEANDMFIADIEALKSKKKKRLEF